MRVDASLAGHGAGAGNCPIEPFVAVATLEGWQHGCDLFALQDAPTTWSGRCRTGRSGSIGRRSRWGYAGVYSSFLRHAEAAAKQLGVDASTILLEVGRRDSSAVKEDMIVDIALDLSAR